LIGRVAIVAGAIVTTVLILDACLDSYKNSEWSSYDTKHSFEGVVIGITLIVVAIPEGLPLAVTLALAFAVHALKKEKCFVRFLHSCETMGCVDELLLDKTGTLTTNDMTCTRVWIG